MPGIYSRDNFAAGLQNALEAALRRREAYMQRDAARRDANVKSITNFMDEVGRSAEEGAEQRDKLAALEAERNAILKAQEDKNQAVLDANGRSLAAEQLMQGYRPNSALAVPDKETAAYQSAMMQGYAPGNDYRLAGFYYPNSRQPVTYSQPGTPDNYDYLSAMQGIYRRNR